MAKLIVMSIIAAFIFIFFADISKMDADGTLNTTLPLLPSMFLNSFRVNSTTFSLSFSLNLYDNYKASSLARLYERNAGISEVEIDLLSEGGVWVPCYKETPEAKTNITGYSKEIRLLCMKWNPEENAYDVYVYHDGTRWMNHTTIGIGNNTTIHYYVGVWNNISIEGKVRIYVENISHIRIEWDGKTYPTTEYLGVWVKDYYGNQNASVFLAGDCGESRLDVREMRPLSIEVHETLMPTFFAPSVYVEADDRKFLVGDFLALRLAGAWSFLNVAWFGDFGWVVFGNSSAHSFVIRIRDWEGYKDVFLLVRADCVEKRIVIRIVYWWEDLRSLGVFLFFLAGVIFLAVRKASEKK